MAVYTRDHAKASARLAKENEEFTVAIAINEDFTGIQVHNYPKRAQVYWQGLERLKEVTDGRVVLITEKMIKDKFPFANTIKDLEVIFYQLVNAKIQSLERQKQQEKEQLERFNPVIYVSDVGYNSRRMRFYVKVKETDKSIWLQRIGSRVVGGNDLQSPIVTANTTEKIGDVFTRRKKEGTDSITIGNYEFANVWDGKPIQEYSD